MPMGACNGKSSTDTVPPGEEKPEEENGMQEPVAESADTENGTEEAKTPSAADNKKLASQKSRSRRRGSVRTHTHTYIYIYPFFVPSEVSSPYEASSSSVTLGFVSIKLAQSSDHHHMSFVIS